MLARRAPATIGGSTSAARLFAVEEAGRTTKTSRDSDRRRTEAIGRRGDSRMNERRR